MTLSPEHRKSISQGLKQRWEKKRRVERAMEEVVKAARKVVSPSNIDIHGQHLVQLNKALEGLDDEIASD